MDANPHSMPLYLILLWFSCSGSNEEQIFCFKDTNNCFKFFYVLRKCYLIQLFRNYSTILILFCGLWNRFHNSWTLNKVSFSTCKDWIREISSLLQLKQMNQSSLSRSEKRISQWQWLYRWEKEQLLTGKSLSCNSNVFCSRSNASFPNAAFCGKHGK